MRYSFQVGNEASGTKGLAVNTNKWFSVRIAGQTGCSFSRSDYSKYDKRFSDKYKGKLRGQIYGLAQALDHIKELRRYVYNGKKIYKNATFEIFKTVQTETIFKTLSAS